MAASAISKPKVYVYGRDREYRRLVRGAALWMLNDLVSQRLGQGLTIRIKLIRDLYKGEDIMGDCEWIDDNRRPKEFAVRLYAGPNRKRTLKTLAHELIHVKQFAKRELYDHIINPDLSTWKGQRVNSKEVDYSAHPWEQEAYAMEVSLLNRWAIDTDNEKYIWRSKR